MSRFRPLQDWCQRRSGRTASHLDPLPRSRSRSSENLVSGAALSFIRLTESLFIFVTQWVVDHLFSNSFWLNYNRKLHLDIRRRAIRKRERDAGKAVKGA